MNILRKLRAVEPQKVFQTIEYVIVIYVSITSFLNMLTIAEIIKLDSLHHFFPRSCYFSFIQRKSRDTNGSSLLSYGSIFYFLCRNMPHSPMLSFLPVPLLKTPSF